jgi:hypothetical protein
MSANISSFFRSCYDNCIQADAVLSWRPDAGALEAGRGRFGGRTRAEQTQDAGVMEAGHRQSGRKTQALCLGQTWG